MMKKTDISFRQPIGYILIAVLVIAMTGCPLLDLPVPLKPLAVEKTDKFAFKTANPANSACRITGDQVWGKYIYDNQGRLYQYITYNNTVTFYYNSEGYLISQEMVSTDGIACSRKYHYSGGSLSKVEQTYGEYLSELQFEGRALVSLKENIVPGIAPTSKSFKTDANGRIIELPTGGYQNGVLTIKYYEYDVKGNLVKVYDNVSPNLSHVFRHDEKPNPIYQVTRFKGHPETGIIDYLGMNIGRPDESYIHQPNNQIYREMTVWNFVTNTPQKSIQTWDFNYNSAGYPVSYNAIHLGKPDVLRWGEYENCN